MKISTTNFTAIGTYTDGTTANITSRVTWTTDNTNVATINNTTGVATGVAVGSLVVNASLSGITSNSAALTVTVANDIAAWGDSLTPGMVRQLQPLFPMRTVFNGGVGGQKSTQIAARQGGVVPLLTLAGNAIPADGGVGVIAQTAYVHNNQGPGVVLGTLAGVHGSLTYDNVSTYTFTRTTIGEVIAVNPTTPFIVDTFNRNAWINVFWYGRNNYSNPVVVKADIAASVVFLAPSNQRFIVVSILNGGYGGYESLGGVGYNSITQLNNELSTLYPQNYLDIRAYLVGQYDPAIFQDVIDFQNDVIPSSLRSDAIHLNTRGSLLVAQKIQEFIRAKGW